MTAKKIEKIIDWLNIRWRHFLASHAYIYAALLLIGGPFIFFVHKKSGLPYWILFIMTLAAMFLNGLLAEHEDNSPGGFNNPSPAKKDSKEMDCKDKVVVPQNKSKGREL